MSKTSISIRLEDEQIKQVTSYMEANHLKSKGEAIEKLLQVAFAKAEFDSLNTLIESRLDEIEDRLVKVTSRGTKASLASLIATSTYLPPVGNLVNSLHHIDSTAWGMLGIDIRDQNVQKDQAVLMEWRNKTPSDFFNFCWQAGGKASWAGAQANYSSATKGLHDYSYADEMTLPIAISDQLRGDGWLEECFGKDFATRWDELRRTRKDLAEKGCHNDYEYMVANKVESEFSDMRKEIEERASYAIDKLSCGLVFDPTVDDLWRKPTESEQEEQKQKISDLCINMGIVPPETEPSIGEGWKWWEDLEPGDTIEDAKFFIADCKRNGFPVPRDYDGRWDVEIEEGLQ